VAAWEEPVNGRRVADIREVTRGLSTAVSLGPIARLSEHGPASYPVVAPTADGIIAVWMSGGPCNIRPPCAAALAAVETAVEIFNRV
jgi:hypothetical protein